MSRLAFEGTESMAKITPLPRRETPERDEDLSKAGRLRALLTAPELGFLMEAHNGLSAKLVEEAGFAGIWASGLSISAALGVRDSNEASWTQVLEVLEFMSDATTIPILVDGDTGYGNFNNVRRLVRKLCQRRIAGVAIEDKLFPKTNSFIGEGQPLADINEFCGKIKAGKDSQTDPDFCLIARTEALVSGWDVNEALDRAAAYHEAGADGVLVHSKHSTANEVLAFMAQWENRCPVVIVPTMYYRTPTSVFEEAGISMVIWANHNLRASITAMREASRRIFEEQNLTGVEGRIASVKDVFQLAGNQELAEAERRYLAPDRQSQRAILLAASRGAALGSLTEEQPKCMIDVRGKPLLNHLVDTFGQSGIADITVVRGYKKEKIDLASVATVDNDAFEETGEVASLACAADRFAGPCVISYGDILFRNYVLDDLLDFADDIIVVVDANWRERGLTGTDAAPDLVSCSRPFTGRYLDDDVVRATAMGPAVAPAAADGEWIGLVKLSDAGANQVAREIEAMGAEGAARSAGLPELFGRLVARGVPVRVMYIEGHWLDIDDLFDLASARNQL